MAAWTILTCEYPPACGGVADYTAQVATALTAVGDDVTVFTPPSRIASGADDDRDRPRDLSRIDLRILPDRYGAASRRTIGRRLDEGPSIVLVQYVPTAFGMKGGNLPWCRWLETRAKKHGGDIRVMFHEPYFEYTRRPFRQNALAAAQRLMAKALLAASARTYLSTDAWRPYLNRYAPRRRRDSFVTLPIPSAIPSCDRPAETAARRADFLGRSSASQLVGHFGTYGSHVTPLLKLALTTLLAEAPDVAVVCAGAGSAKFVESMLASAPRLETRLHAIGHVSAVEVAVTLSACDLLLQPYPDGVTTRRTSTMSGLINGRAVLTTTGRLTESVWASTGAVALTPADDMIGLARMAQVLLADDDARAALAARGEKTYRDRFSLSHTIRALRGAAEGAAA